MHAKIRKNTQYINIIYGSTHTKRLHNMYLHSYIQVNAMSFTSENNAIGYFPNSARTAWLLSCLLILSTNL